LEKSNGARYNKTKDSKIYDEVSDTLESAILLMPIRREITGSTRSEISNDAENKKSLNKVDAFVADIIAEMPLEANVGTANLEEDELRVFELTLGKYLRYKLGNMPLAVSRKLKEDCIAKAGDKNLDEIDAAGVILRELWNQLRKTYKLRVLK